MAGGHECAGKGDESQDEGGDDQEPEQVPGVNGPAEALQDKGDTPSNEVDKGECKES